MYGLIPLIHTTSSHTRRNPASAAVVLAAAPNRPADLAAISFRPLRFPLTLPAQLVQCGLLLMERCPISMRVVKSQLSHSLSALAVLAEAGRGARLTDVVAALDAPKSSVQRLLQQLADEDWVEQDPETGYYRLTVRMAVLGPALSAHDRHCRCDAGGAANRCEQDARACTFNDCRHRPPGLDRLGARRAVGADVSTRDRRTHRELRHRQRQSLARDVAGKRRQPHRAARRHRSEKTSDRCRPERHAVPRRAQARSRAGPFARLCDRGRGRRARRHGDRGSRSRSGQRKGARHDQHCRAGVAIVERPSRQDRRRAAQRRRATTRQNLAAEAGRRKNHTPGDAS